MKFKISKTLLFTSLAAVALLGVTQQVSATSMELHQGYYWVEEETGEIDGYPWGLRNWDSSNSEENGPYEPPYGGALGTGYDHIDYPQENGPYEPPYGGALGTGYDHIDYPQENGPYEPPYGGALGTGKDYDKSPGIPPRQDTPWPEKNGFEFGPNYPREAEWGHAVQ
ncbi:hypothetical protein BBG03_04280 [Streptococcus dysgalactiae subsp. equisimilis]|nr:hypothetical protein BBG03_04280 [Streptococcus dysgalactiae subsp. equisimilis]